MKSARSILVALHRWCGLASALFLLLTGLTGALIAWHDELDSWLNPELFAADGVRALRSPLELARALEARDARLRVRYLPLEHTKGKTLSLWVEPRMDATTGAPFALDFDQVMLDPESGRVRGSRRWGEPALARKNLVPFLYKLHYSLHLPDAGGIALGSLFMGGIALVWTLDAFVALWISFPRLATWRRSFAFRLRAGAAKLTFDLHRSGGVWIWALMLTLAVTAVSLSLRRELVAPLVSLFSPLARDIFDEPPLPLREPLLTREQVVERATREGKRRGFREAPGGIVYLAPHAAYGVGFFAEGEEIGSYGLGNPWLYFDARDGSLRGESIPGAGTAGDLFMQAQFPLHSGRILGRPGRALISLLGLAIAALSITGLMLWARKRLARRARRTGR